MTISVLIPAYNEAGGLASTLAAIAAGMTAFHTRGWHTEVIVCDNNSTDATAEIAGAAGATVIFEPINQIARARNAAAAAARGDWFVFVDADSLPSAALFVDVADAIATGHVIGGGATMALATRRRWVRVGQAMWNWTSRFTRVAAGAFVFVEARAFRAEGGFSTRFFAGEELDLSRRLKRRARREGLEFRILARHPVLTSDRKLHLYSGWEMARFLARTVLSGGRALRRREDCFVWYDGRR